MAVSCGQRTDEWHQAWSAGSTRTAETAVNEPGTGTGFSARAPVRATRPSPRSSTRCRQQALPASRVCVNEAFSVNDW